MYQKSIVREYFEAGIVAITLALFARTFVFQAFKIPSSSMVPTLLVGDHIFVNKMIYADAYFDLERIIMPIREIRRGDIIVFKYPGNPDIDYIKRVIGIGGDVVKGIDGVVYVNDEPLKEPYAIHQHERYGFGFGKDTFGPVRVPEGHYFVMGDNRDNSEDSRYWGTVPEVMVKGRAFLIYWSFKPPPGFYDTGRPRNGTNFFYDLIVAFNPARIRWGRLLNIIR